MISRSLRRGGRPRVMDMRRLRSLAFKRRVTNRERSWNKSLIFCWIDLLLRALRRAACAVDDGRPRFNVGLDGAKRSRAGATAFKTPGVRSWMLWKGHS